MKLIHAVSISFLLLFSSCDKIMTAIKEEFDSERIPSNIPAKIQASLPSRSNSLNEEGNFVYLIRGHQVSCKPSNTYENSYILHMQSIDSPLVAFGGIQRFNADTINNIIFFNEWSQGTSRRSAFILLQESDKSPLSCMTVSLSKPEYDKGSQSASFVLTPDGEMRSEFLDQKLDSCILLIHFDQEAF